nr:tol-pal system-associated acyl-CoA thioesterase [Bartonella rattaustraliani]
MTKTFSFKSDHPNKSDHTGDFHDFQVRVYVADTDFSGVVYHARYLEFLERGRSEFLRDTGFNNKMLASGAEGEKLFFVVRHMEINFLRPAQIDNLLTLKTRINHVQGARFFMEQYILHENSLLITAKVEIALINESGKPRRLPKELFVTMPV